MLRLYFAIPTDRKLATPQRTIPYTNQMQASAICQGGLYRLATETEANAALPHCLGASLVFVTPAGRTEATPQNTVPYTNLMEAMTLCQGGVYRLATETEANAALSNWLGTSLETATTGRAGGRA